MNRCQLTILPTVFLTLVGLLATSMNTQAQSPGYQTPNFYGATQAGGGQYRPATAFPASPLAGGPSAASGDAFMDVRGRPIVMQTNYCQSYPSGGYGPGGACNNGDPMAVDFGGCAEDQCGPHYFDVAIDSVFLKSDDLVGDNLLPFSSSGVGGAPPPPNTTNPQLDPRGQSDDYEPGWRIAVRYDIGALSVFEATYMGLYDFGFDMTASDEDNLFSIFTQYGIAPDPDDNISGIKGLDGSDRHDLNYKSDLQSTEFTYRRYWVGHRPRFSGTILAGARYVRLTEGLAFSAYESFDAPIGQPDLLTGQITYSDENDLVGFQIGGDGWVSLRQGLRLGVDGKAGIYNNQYQFNATNHINPDFTDPDDPTEPTNPQLPENGDQVAFVGEAGISFVADILPSWSLTGGYHALYLNSVVSLNNNVATTQYFTGNPPDTNPETLAPALSTQGHVLYHGFHGGLEYVW